MKFLKGILLELGKNVYNLECKNKARQLVMFEGTRATLIPISEIKRIKASNYLVFASKKSEIVEENKSGLVVSCLNMYDPNDLDKPIQCYLLIDDMETISNAIERDENELNALVCECELIYNIGEK